MKSTNSKSFVVDEGVLVLSCKHISTPPAHTPFVTSVIYGYFIEPILYAQERLGNCCSSTLNGLDLARHEKKSLRNYHQILVDLSGRAWSEKLTTMDENCGTGSRVSDWYRFFSEWTNFVEIICSFYNVKHIKLVVPNSSIINLAWLTAQDILKNEQVDFIKESESPK